MGRWTDGWGMDRWVDEGWMGDGRTDRWADTTTIPLCYPFLLAQQQSKNLSGQDFLHLKNCLSVGDVFPTVTVAGAPKPSFLTGQHFQRSPVQGPLRPWPTGETSALRQCLSGGPPGLGGPPGPGTSCEPPSSPGAAHGPRCSARLAAVWVAAKK